MGVHARPGRLARLGLVPLVLAFAWGIWGGSCAPEPAGPVRIEPAHPADRVAQAFPDRDAWALAAYRLGGVAGRRVVVRTTSGDRAHEGDVGTTAEEDLLVAVGVRRIGSAGLEEERREELRDEGATWLVRRVVLGRGDGSTSSARTSFGLPGPSAGEEARWAAEVEEGHLAPNRSRRLGSWTAGEEEILRLEVTLRSGR